MKVVRCPSGSKIKLDAVKKALSVVFPEEVFDLRGLPVELQARPDMNINAQPEGEEETVGYAHERWHEMCRQYGPTIDFDVSIESGAFDGNDVAVVAVYSVEGVAAVVCSEGIAFPARTLDEARHRGFDTTTAGDIIHEWHPEVSSNNWQEHFPPYTSRKDQIAEAVMIGFRRLVKH